MALGSRQERILQLVRDAGRLSVDHLCQLMEVSPATIRRDLQMLERQQLVLRVHGGVVSSGNEASVPEKELSHVMEKQEICRIAASLIQEGEVILLDAGTTTGMLAKSLSRFKHLTIVTNGLNIVAGLLPYEHLNVILLGGDVRAINQAVIGPLTQDNLRHVNPARAFVGTYGINIQDRTIASPTLAQAYLKEQMMSTAQHVYLLADHSKVGNQFHGFATPIPPNTVLVTDSGLSYKHETELRDSEIVYLTTTPSVIDGSVAT